MDRSHLLRSIVGWLRAGYPHGVPVGDYIPLVALLRRQLTDDEVGQIADHLATEAATDPDFEPITRVDVAVLITKVTDEMPADADIDRVRSVLEGAGWTCDIDSPKADPS
ncbi:DUF3349 domain-containing protein [Williamsia sp. SKLECPSW1]